MYGQCPYIIQSPHKGTLWDFSKSTRHTAQGTHTVKLRNFSKSPHTGEKPEKIKVPSTGNFREKNNLSSTGIFFLLFTNALKKTLTLILKFQRYLIVSFTHILIKSDNDEP